MRTFREMHGIILEQNQQFVTRFEMELLSSKVTEISADSGLRDKQKQTDKNVGFDSKNVEQPVKILFRKKILRIFYCKGPEVRS